MNALKTMLRVIILDTIATTRPPNEGAGREPNLCSASLPAPSQKEDIEMKAKTGLFKMSTCHDF